MLKYMRDQIKPKTATCFASTITTTKHNNGPVTVVNTNLVDQTLSRYFFLNLFITSKPHYTAKMEIS